MLKWIEIGDLLVLVWQWSNFNIAPVVLGSVSADRVWPSNNSDIVKLHATFSVIYNFFVDWQWVSQVVNVRVEEFAMVLLSKSHLKMAGRPTVLYWLIHILLFWFVENLLAVGLLWFIQNSRRRPMFCVLACFF